MVVRKGALRKELGNDIPLPGGGEAQRRAAQTVIRMVEQLVQGYHRAAPGEIGGDVVRVGDAHIGGGVGGDIGDDVVIDLAVIRIQPKVYGNVGVQSLKIRNGLLIDPGLRPVGVVLGPEGDGIAAAFVELFGGNEIRQAPGAMAAGKKQHPRNQHQDEQEGKQTLHPLVPPLETPSMTFFRKTRNRTIKGREMATTAAIMAGIFSRPKPFSRIS